MYLIYEQINTDKVITNFKFWQKIGRILHNP